METTKQKRLILEIRLFEARLELVNFDLRSNKLGSSTKLVEQRKHLIEHRLRILSGELEKLKLNDVAYQMFLADYKMLTDKIYIFEQILQKDNTFENSKNVKKYVKRRKQLKNAYLKESGITVSELNNMIVKSLKRGLA